MVNYSCPVCYSTAIDIFIDIPQIPVYCNLLYKTREEAINADRADMNLGYCEKCGHVYNFTFDATLMDYAQDYENSLYFSPRFQKYAEALAHRLVERFDLHEKNIVEIGCGDGDFLELLCRIGNNRGFGFDPSHVPELHRKDIQNRITFIRDYYSEKYSHYQADLICCRHVLEHIQYPRKFLETLGIALAKHPDTVVYFEVPNVLYTLKDLGIWDLIYEHCSYFSPSSLQTVFAVTGFELLHQNQAFDSQFLCIEARPNRENRSQDTKTEYNQNDLHSYVQRFEEQFRDKVARWKQKLRVLQLEGKTATVWGAGSKGATFLNIVKMDNTIDYVVDINPRKQGNYIAGSGQKIIPPNFLTELNPDTVVVMNPIYLEEIRKILNQIGFAPEILSV